MSLFIRIKAPVLNFKEDHDLLGVFNLSPEQALKFFQGKGLNLSFDWRDLVGEEHLKSFTVAKMMDMDLLSTTQEFISKAIAEGKSIDWFKHNLVPHLTAKGWWGRQIVVDPLTGQTFNAQLGSAHRLEMIFRTNMQSSYSVGHWEQIQTNADIAPWLLYVAVDDFRTRQSHKELDGTLLKVDDPFWQQYYPPNGWQCRCSTIQISEFEKKELGLVENAPPLAKNRNWTNPRTGKTSKIPENLDPGWNVNMGQLHQDALNRTLAEKAAALEPKQKDLIETFLKQRRLNAAVAALIVAEQEKERNKDKLKALEEEKSAILASILKKDKDQ